MKQKKLKSDFMRKLFSLTPSPPTKNMMSRSSFAWYFYVQIYQYWDPKGFLLWSPLGLFLKFLCFLLHSPLHFYPKEGSLKQLSLISIDLLCPQGVNIEFNYWSFKFFYYLPDSLFSSKLLLSFSLRVNLMSPLPSLSCKSLRIPPFSLCYFLFEKPSLWFFSIEREKNTLKIYRYR